ncbi:hypothetical protein QYF36_023528 [Acer negundo]|nr:hypothetical protein QYF36_023528 [Acer negundo]
MTFMADVDIACMASMVSVHTSHDLNVKPFVVVVVGFKSSRFGRLQNIKCAIPVIEDNSEDMKSNSITDLES